MSDLYDKELEDLYNKGGIPTLYIPGTGADFVVYIQGLGNKAQLHSINGKFRWVVTTPKGERSVVRPDEAK